MIFLSFTRIQSIFRPLSALNPRHRLVRFPVICASLHCGMVHPVHTRAQPGLSPPTTMSCRIVHVKARHASKESIVEDKLRAVRAASMKHLPRLNAALLDVSKASIRRHHPVL